MLCCNLSSTDTDTGTNEGMGTENGKIRSSENGYILNSAKK